MLGIIAGVVSVVAISTTLLGVIDNAQKKKKDEEDKKVSRRSDRKSKRKGRKHRVLTKSIDNQKPQNITVENLASTLTGLNIESPNLTYAMPIVSDDQSVSTQSYKELGARPKILLRRDAVVTCNKTPNVQSGKASDSDKLPVQDTGSDLMLGAKPKILLRRDAAVTCNKTPDVQSRKASDSNKLPVQDTDPYFMLGARPKTTRSRKILKHPIVRQLTGLQTGDESCVQSVSSDLRSKDKMSGRSKRYESNHEGNIGHITTDANVLVRGELQLKAANSDFDVCKLSKSVLFEIDIDRHSVSSTSSSYGSYRLSNVSNVCHTSSTVDSMMLKNVECAPVFYHINSQNYAPVEVRMSTLRTLHFIFCRIMLSQMFTMSYGNRIIINAHTDSIITNITPYIKIARLLLKTNVLMHCGFATCKHHMRRQLMMFMKMMFYGRQVNPLLLRMASLNDHELDPIQCYRIACYIFNKHCKNQDTAVSHVLYNQPSGYFAHILDLLYRCIYAKLAVVHSKYEITVLNNLTFSSVLALGSMYYTMISSSLDGACQDTNVPSTGQLMFYSVVRKKCKMPFLGYDLGYICYRMWLAMFYMYNGELVGVVPASLAALLSEHGMNQIQESYNQGCFNFEMIIGDLCSQVAKYADRRNFDIVSSDILKYGECIQVNDQNSDKDADKSQQIICEIERLFDIQEEEDIDWKKQDSSQENNQSKSR
ncbi:hypothetical protein EHRUM3_01090 [Ehrlichia ruminantium]|uniref:DUF3514 domain-containing protein n=1 Tax=Ehrlichia ruminantium TaxID=779 RepID=A0A161LY08_EHRRU|nr:DUF3514 domain-containing protein [Ehrlichia ruminantium]GAT76890.1 hypothetical protein EHRUM2_00880 [Ehrlichia ruminantium]GAT77907.1 hypothetical protein EHRUM3_01090 [Ehrlichia ruminantium]